MKNFIIFVFTFCSLILSANAIESIVFDGYIADNANLISAGVKTELNKTLNELKQKTKAELGVVTLNSLDGRLIEDVSLEIARKFALGDKQLNNGVLFVIAPNEKKTRIEIGYGLEGAITDAHAGRILDNYSIPYFKTGNYEKGIADGTTVLAEDIAKYYNNTLNTEVPKAYNNYTDTLLVLFVFAFIAVYLFLFLFPPFVNILNFIDKQSGGKYTKKLEKLNKIKLWLDQHRRTVSHNGRSRYHGSGGGFHGGGGGFGGGGSSRGW